MKCHVFAVVAVVAAAGCASDAPAAYPIDAVALLGPLRSDLPYVTGPIEVLGTGKPSGVQDGGPRTLAAYRVQLPYDLAPRLVVINGGACSDQASVLRPDRGGALQDLGVLRRVGEETHFFVPVEDGGQMVYVDTETTTVFASRTGRISQLVIAVSPDDFRVLACGALTWR